MQEKKRTVKQKEDVVQVSIVSFSFLELWLRCELFVLVAVLPVWARLVAIWGVVRRKAEVWAIRIHIANLGELEGLKMDE